MTRFLDALVADTRYTLRMMLRNPGFAAITVAALALGIGANSAIFSIVNGILLRPLPYPEADRIVMVWRTTAQEKEQNHSGPDFLDFQADTTAYSHIAAYREDVFDLTTTGADPERLEGVQVTAGFFDVLGVPALAGRVFHPAQDTSDSERLAVLGHTLWSTRFARDPSAVGRTIRLNGESFTIAGIMPEGFSFPDRMQIWALARKKVPSSPIETPKGDARENRNVRYLSVIGRLRPGVTLEQARTDAGSIANTLEQRFPDSGEGGFRLVPLQEQLVGMVRPALLVILTAVGFVLLIACANIASLLLARAAARQREVGVKVALGASRGRLVRQLLTESVLFGISGGALGLLVAFWGTDLLVAAAPADIPRLTDVRVDARVVAFTFIVSVATGLLFGLTPAFQLSHVDVTKALRENSGRTAGSVGRRIASHALVVAEVALALVLLVGAGLMLNSFIRLQRTDPGFTTTGVTVVELPIPSARYPETGDQIRLYRGVLERISAMGPFNNSALAWPVPMWGGSGSAGLNIEGRPERARSDRPAVAIASVSPGYFKVMNVPLVAGRDVTFQDSEKALKVVVISESLARLHFPGESPLGRRLNFGSEGAEWFTIVGLVGDVRLTQLREEPQPTVYFSFQQFPIAFLNVVTRTRADAAAVQTAVSTSVHELDRDLPIGEVRTMSDIVAGSAAEPRFRALLLGVFATLALVLAAIGVYGVISQSVARRAPEIGIRMALGASPSQMLGLILRQGLVLALVGLGVGLLASLALTRLLSSLLFGVEATDPATFALVSLLLLFVAAFATYLPARRAMKVDPVIALRAE